MKVAAIVLCGGKNLRLGRNKALETLGGRTLIELTIEKLRPLASQILAVTSQQQQSELALAGEATVVADVYPNGGPLGGIYTGLLAARFQRSIVVACDMPFLNIDLLQHMISLSRGFDAVVPRLNENMMEPLHAVYSRSCLDGMREMLEHNDLRVSYFLSNVRVRYIERNECERFDPQLLSFFNINYQADLDRARSLLEEQALTHSNGR